MATKFGMGDEVGDDLDPCANILSRSDKRGAFFLSSFFNSLLSPLPRAGGRVHSDSASFFWGGVLPLL